MTTAPATKSVAPRRHMNALPPRPFPYLPPSLPPRRARRERTPLADNAGTRLVPSDELDALVSLNAHDLLTENVTTLPTTTEPVEVFKTRR